MNRENSRQTFRHPREVLNELKWCADRDISNAKIWYVSRGAPDDVALVSGSEIKKIGTGFFELENASIPYHRVRKIVYEEEILYERRR